MRLLLCSLVCFLIPDSFIKADEKKNTIDGKLLEGDWQLILPDEIKEKSNFKILISFDGKGRATLKTDISGKEMVEFANYKLEGDKLTIIPIKDKEETKGKVETITIQSLTSEKMVAQGPNGKKVELIKIQSKKQTLFEFQLINPAVFEYVLLNDADIDEKKSIEKVSLFKAEVDEKKLIGKWMLDSKEKSAVVIEFTKDSKLVLSIDKATINGSYKLTGNTLQVELSFGGKNKSENLTVTKLDDNTLITKDEKGREDKFTRVKK